MLCPSCGKSIPVESLFCMFCGKTVTANQSSVPLNTRPPIEITELGARFETGMEEYKKREGLIIRKFQIYFKLLDDRGESTAFDGTARVKLDFEQGEDWVLGRYGGYSSVNHGNAEETITVSTSDYFRSSDKKYEGQIWYGHQLSKPLIISLHHNVNFKMEVWFVPANTDKKLYRVYTFYLTPT